MASISKINVGGTDYTLTPASHTHGNIQNGGTLQTNDITIASGDKLVVTDSSNSSKVARTSLSFDGSTTTQFLSKKGTWATPTISLADAFPVGSVLQNTTNTNPSTYITGTTWTLISSVALASNHVFGNGYTLGLTDGTNKMGFQRNNVNVSQNGALTANSSQYGGTPGTSQSGNNSTTSSSKVLGVVTKTLAGTNPEYSGLVADTITVYTFERTA